MNVLNRILNRLPDRLILTWFIFLLIISATIQSFRGDR